MVPPNRCAWARTGNMIDYHDKEWGVPVHDDRLLFEFLILEGAQAGLSWSTILNKRENYRKAFDGFDPSKVARYGEARNSEAAAERGHRPQPPQGRCRGCECEGVSGSAEGIRQLRRLHLAICRRPAGAERWREISEVPARSADPTR